MTELNGPTIAELKKARQQLGRRIITTPVWRCHSPFLKDIFGAETKTEVWLKLEIWQYAGSFKARAALLSILKLSPKEKQNGVVAITAGNHGLAVAYAGNLLKVPVKIFMPKTASPIRIEKCRYYGAEVVLMENIQELFEKAHIIEKEEKRKLLHPFNGFNIALGTGTLGLELHQQIKNLDAILVPVGGGGLITGIANAYKQLNPKIKIYGIEPEGAQVMTMSLKAGKPVKCQDLHSIADSLCAPCTEPYPFSLCQRWVDEMILVKDAEIIQAMRFLFTEMKLAVEPAAATGLAALFGPLKKILTGKKIALILSGTNIDEKDTAS